MHARRIARVLPLVGLAHLDREFDYLVPDELDDIALPGARVRVRFAGRLVDGFIVERIEFSEHAKLGRLERVVSDERVLTPEILRLASDVAERFAGTRGDIVRLAVPPRHARTEADGGGDSDPVPQAPDLSAWSIYAHGDSFVEGLRAGRVLRAAWQAVPTEDWPVRLVELAAATAAAGRGALLIVPDKRDLERLSTACKELGVAHVALAAEQGPAARYRRWLRVLRGQSKVVIGTRGSVYAPVHNLGLIVVWDDGDDNLVEQRAPYAHTREVALLRAHQGSCSIVLGGFARTAEVALLVQSGYLHDLVAPRPVLRQRTPRINATGDSDIALSRDPRAAQARIPSEAFGAVRACLDAGRPVLVQVPRRGYLPAVACGKCREPARCRACHGPIQSTSRGMLSCTWCGRAATAKCTACGSDSVRAMMVGAERTAEELARAFAGATLIKSQGETVVAAVPAKPALVVATIGAEPVATGGYGLALLLDGWVTLGRADLRANEEAFRRWAAAASLVAADGRVLVMADAAHRVVQALVRWDPVGLAEEELRQRTEVGFPPAVRMASLEGVRGAVDEVLGLAELPPGADVLGPIDAAEPEQVRALVRVPRTDSIALARGLAAAQGVRSARKRENTVRIRIDPARVG